VVDGTTMESSRTTRRDRERGGLKERKGDGQKEGRVEEKKRAQVAATSGGFLVVQVAVKNS